MEMADNGTHLRLLQFKGTLEFQLHASPSAWFSTNPEPTGDELPLRTLELGDLEETLPLADRNLERSHKMQISFQQRDKIYSSRSTPSLGSLISFHEGQETCTIHCSDIFLKYQVNHSEIGCTWL